MAFCLKIPDNWLRQMSDKEKQEFLNGDSENRTEEQESEDSSDEEPPIGLLDRPIEILYTKREKRVSMLILHSRVL